MTTILDNILPSFRSWYFLLLICCGFYSPNVKQKTKWKCFCPLLPDIRKSVALFAGSQASPACSYGKSSPMMKLRVEHWRNDTDRMKEKYFFTNLSLCHSVHHKSHVGRFGASFNQLTCITRLACHDVFIRATGWIYWFIFVIRKLTEKRREFNLETNTFSSLNRIFVEENNNELFAISFN
jgi:hypothetical protein